MKKRWVPIGVTTLFLMPIVSIALLGSWNTFQVKELPVLSQIPDFELEKGGGGTLSLADLSGKVWIASFVFTTCSGQCPIIVERVRRLQHDLRHRTEVRFVSISVDPERDSPEILTRYAQKAEANPLKWFFLTGELETIQRILREGFKLVREEGAPGEEAVLHSSKLALVDPWGRVRGYYDANEPQEMKRLLKEIRRLIKKAY